MSLPRAVRDGRHVWVLVGGERIEGVHHRKQCAGRPCTIHRPSAHHMRHWRQHWRGDRGIMERICEHGVGHPDPDDYRVMLYEYEGIHGCDGCCRGEPYG